MRRELYRSRVDPLKKHAARLGRKKTAPEQKRVIPPPKQGTFINITQEQKHGRGPRR